MFFKKIIYIFICFLQGLSLWGMAPGSSLIKNVDSVSYREKEAYFDQLFSDIQNVVRDGGFHCEIWDDFEDRFFRGYETKNKVVFDAIVNALKKIFIDLSQEKRENSDIVNKFLYKLFIKYKALDLLPYCPRIKEKEHIVYILQCFQNYSEDDEKEACEVITNLLLPLGECSYQWCKVLWDEIRFKNPCLDRLVDLALQSELMDARKKESAQLLFCSTPSSTLFLLNEVIDPQNYDGEGNSILHMILQKPNFEHSVLRDTLIEIYSHLLLYKNPRGVTPIHLAAQFHPRLFLELVREGRVILPEEDESRTSSGETLLHFAASRENKEVVVFLLGQGYSAYARDIMGKTPLHLIVQFCPRLFLELVREGRVILPEEDESCTQLRETLLHFAVSGQDKEVIDFLLRRGYSAQARDITGKTPLHFLATPCVSCFHSASFLSGHFEDIILMLTPDKEGLDIQDEDGNTALHLAIKHRQFSCYQALMKMGANLYIQNRRGRTFLHELAFCGIFFCHINFLKHMCDDDVLKIQDNDGNTALHLVSTGDGRGLLGFLLSKEAGLRIRNKKGHTPLLHVMSEGTLFHMIHFLSYVQDSSVVWKVEDVQEVFDETRKNGRAHFCFEILKEFYPDASFEVKRQWREEFLDILDRNPCAFASFNAYVLTEETEFGADLRDSFCELAVEKNVPISFHFNHFSEDKLERFYNILEKIPEGHSLLTEGFGTLLMFMIVHFCLADRPTFKPYGECALKLIQKGCGVNELTPHGTPLSHILYIMSERSPAEVKSVAYPLINALLDAYLSEVKVRKGQALDPKEAERQHMGVIGEFFLEYGENPLFATLATTHSSCQLYDKVKEIVSLTEVNGFKRNFLHHLSLLDSGFESDLNGIFKRRGLSSEDIQTLVNQKDVDGMTPLMYAAYRPKMLELLLKLGADYDAVDKRGFSIRHHLIIAHCEDSIRVFLRHLNIPFKETDDIKILRSKCGVSLDDPVSFGVSFREQVQNLVACDKRYLALLPGVDGWVLSSHISFRCSFLVNLENMFRDGIEGEEIDKAPADRQLSSNGHARHLLATGGSQRLGDATAFILKTYDLEDPFDVCHAYATYVQADLPFCFQDHSILIDGFNYTFQKTLSLFINGMTIGDIKGVIQSHKKEWFLAQDFLIPLMLKVMVKSSSQMESAFFFELFKFFKYERDLLVERHNILFRYVHIEEEDQGISFDYEALSSYILDDKDGLFFAFCYNLNPKTAEDFEAVLRKLYPALPHSQPTLVASGVWRNRLAIHRSIARGKTKPYVKKLKEHDRKVLKKKKDLEEAALVMNDFKMLFSEVLKDHFPNHRFEDIDESQIKVNGRSVSFEIEGKEVVIKVRKKGEDMRDHAIIAQALQDDDEDVKEQYASAHYVHLSEAFSDKLHDMICDKDRHSKMKCGKDDLKREAAVIVIQHTRYFDYITKEGTSFFDFRTGLKKAMEQSFRQAHKGRFMSSITDFAHDETRPALFFILARFLGAINGVHLGTFRDIAGSSQNLDVSPYGLRDLGNILTEIVSHLEMGLPLPFKVYLQKTREQFIKDGKSKEVHDDSLLLAIQESLSMTIISGVLLILSRLQQDDEMRNHMEFDDFLKLVEDIVIQPFCDAFLLGKKAESFREHYYAMWKEDFEMFRQDPSLLDKSIMIGRRDDVGRDFPFQSLHIFSSFLLSSLPSSKDLDLLMMREGKRGFNDVAKADEFVFDRVVFQAA